MINPEQQPSNPAELEAVPEQVQDFKFVGFEQPKESGLWTFIKKHKFRTAMSSLLAVVLVSFTGIMLVSRTDGRSENADLAKKSNADQKKERVSTEQVAAAEVVNPNDISAREFSLQDSEKYFELVSKSGDIWLTRSDKSWDETESWGDWLFFGARRGDKLGIEAFHLKNKTFLSVAELSVDNLAGVTMSMRVENEFMYVELASASGTGSTHRCTLSEQKACSDMQLFYGNVGNVKLLNPSVGIVVDHSAEESTGVVRVKKLDVSSGVATDIINMQSSGTTNQVVAAVSSDELVWIADLENGTVIQLQAIDFTGARKFILPAQTFPISGAQLVDTKNYSFTGIELHNANQSAVFDIQSKQFGAPKSYVGTVEDDTTKTDIRKIIDISSRLDLPDDFVIRSAQ